MSTAPLCSLRYLLSGTTESAGTTYFYIILLELTRVMLFAILQLNLHFRYLSKIHFPPAFIPIYPLPMALNILQKNWQIKNWQIKLTVKKSECGVVTEGKD